MKPHSVLRIQQYSNLNRYPLIEVNAQDQSEWDKFAQRHVFAIRDAANCVTTSLISL